MKTYKVRKLILIAIAGIFILACNAIGNIQENQTPTSIATSAPAEPTDEDIKAGIQTTLDKIISAYAANDVTLLESALDLENKPFSRFVKTRFNTQQESFYGDGIEIYYSVENVEQREFGLVLAHITYNFEAQVDWYFRELADGNWVLTEPTVEQTGELIVTETDFFEFRTYPIANAENSKVEQLMLNARERVEEMLGKVPEQKIEVEIIPTYGLYPFDNPNALAYYQFEGALIGEGDRMVIYAPNSFLFGWYEKNTGWEQDLEDVLTHEYTHFTHARVFDYSGRLADWIVEGLAEYVDGVNRNGILEEAIASDSLIPLVDTTEGVVYKQDLAHIYILESDVSLAYAEAESLVAFIVEENGGFDAFWSFTKAFSDSGGNLDSALQKSLNLTQAQFEEQWINWLKDSGYFTR